MQSAVTCTGITKWFGTGDAKVQALRGLDLEIGMGELAMLVGPSGCGKTTFLALLARQLEGKPNRRVIYFNAWKYAGFMEIVPSLIYRIIHDGVADGSVPSSGGN